MYAVNLVQKVLEKLNIKIEYVMMRGGYDGAILSQKGLPMPNLFSGGHNAHSVYEFLPVESLKMLSNTIVEIARSIVSDHS